MSAEQSRAEHVHEVLDMCLHALQGPRVPMSLEYATGLLLGVRSLLGTLEEWQGWGACAAALLRAHYEADAGAWEGEG